MQKLVGIERYIIRVINQYNVNMNYSLGYAFNLDDLFMNFDTSKLKLSSTECKNIIGDHHRKELAKKIFKECLKEIINDVIDNNVTFELPTGKKKSNIHMNRIKDSDFAQARRNGKFKEIDFLESNFSGNQLVLEMDTSNAKRTKKIYVDNKLKQKITDNTNNGKQYC